VDKTPLWLRNLDAKERRYQEIGSLGNVAMEKDGED